MSGLASAFDLLLDFATLGEYGLEPVDDMDTPESVQADAERIRVIATDHGLNRKAADVSLRAAGEYTEAAAAHLDRLSEHADEDSCRVYVRAHHECVAAQARLDLAMEDLEGVE